MIITYLGEDKFQIKTANSVVILGEDKVDIEGFVIDSPGEYERKGVFVEAPFDAPIYKISLEGLVILHPGSSKKISDKQLEELDSIDVFFMPYGANGSMDIKDSTNLAGALEPGIIIPMQFADADLKTAGVEVEPVKLAKISKSSLPQEGSETIVLEIASK